MGKDVEVAILFADVVGSTQLYELMGDLRARDTVVNCLEIMKQATEHCNGTVIKTMGDEVMSTFPTADDALNAGRQMQQAINQRNVEANDGVAVAIRIGCHYGSVVREGRDIFGSAVHTANRMTSQAKAGQIITTDKMCSQLSPEWQANVRQIDVATVKGQSEEVALFEVLWQTEDVTSMLPAINIGTQRPRQGKLQLHFQGQLVVVDSKRSNVAIGRAEDNDLVIKGNLISRLHARVELNRTRFMLIDESTNGTFVLTAQGEEAFVRRDAMQLRGEGMIGLGRKPDPEAPQTIRYVAED